MEGTKYSHWFLIVVAVFVTCLITANIIAVKLVDLFGLVLPAAIFIFPLSYITGDVLTEVYGYRQARKVIWLGFLCNVIVVVAVWIAQILPAASFWMGRKRTSAFWVTRHGYCWLLSWPTLWANLPTPCPATKIATRGRWLWLRTIGSTIGGARAGLRSFHCSCFCGGPSR